jgi:hypothetical protein
MSLDKIKKKKMGLLQEEEDAANQAIGEVQLGLQEVSKQVRDRRGYR